MKHRNIITHLCPNVDGGSAQPPLNLFVVTETYGPLFTKRTNVLAKDLVKSRSRDIQICSFQIALKFDRPLGSGPAEMPVKFQSDSTAVTSNLAASKLYEILL